MFLLVDYMVVKVFVFCCEQAPANHKCFFYRGMYSTNIDCFVVDSVSLHLPFVTVRLSIYLSVVNKTI